LCTNILHCYRERFATVLFDQFLSSSVHIYHILSCFLHSAVFKTDAEFSVLLGYCQVENTIRWRHARDEHGNVKYDELGNPVKDSNAKVVRWSDGR